LLRFSKRKAGDCNPALPFLGEIKNEKLGIRNEKVGKQTMKMNIEVDIA
jgi:hypothetical protein